MMSPMKSLSFYVLLATFAALAWLGIVKQANHARQLHFTDESTPPEKQWLENVSPPVEWGKPGAGYIVRKSFAPVLMPWASTKHHEAISEIPSISADIPPGKSGYALNVAIGHRKTSLPASVAVFLNGKLLQKIDTEGYSMGQNKTVEISLSRELLSRSTTNRLVVSNLKGGWQGDISLIPLGPMRTVLPFAIPGLAFLLLAMLACNSAKLPRLAALIIYGTVLFALYDYTLCTKKLAPVNGAFFSDASDMIDTVSRNIWSMDMQKHVSFLPMMHNLYSAFEHATKSRMLIALSSAFALVAALNGIGALLLLRKFFGYQRMATALALIYQFSFVISIYSSIFETYIVSSLFVNLFLLTLASRPPTGRSIREFLLPLGTLALAATAHPPLLVLGSLLLWRLFRSGEPLGRIILRCAAIGVLLLTGYFAIQIAITSSYSIDGEPPGFRGVIHHLQFSRSIIKSYASIANMNLHEAGNVIYAQSIYSLFGCGQGFVWNKGWAGLLAYFATPAGAICASCFLLIFASALLALRRDVRFLKLVAFCGTGVFLPYLAFFLYFNPTEMLLYCAPLEILCVIGIGRALQISFPNRATILLSGTALIIAVNNTIALATYH